ncbi:hypothetical protein CLAIMM_02048 [Cladophialophora immunda]|nr:hypothetical protein CLAIMM_02048 [Cladophialophora immunda]
MTMATADEEASTTPVRILIINPNTSQHMTAALVPVVEGLGFPGAHQHPLVARLKAECARLTAAATRGSGGGGARKYVTGIFEASVLASLALLGESEWKPTTGGEDVSGEPRPAFGIVSTGKVWEEALQNAVQEFLGCPATSTMTAAKSPFVGCETTGLNASELHDLPADEVRRKMMHATKRLLLRGKTDTDTINSSSTETTTSRSSPGDTNTDTVLASRVHAICLGCAGMVGLDSAVRTACVEALGEDRGKAVYIVDGVKAGVGALYGLARGGF